MLTVSVSQKGGRYIEFIRIDIIAQDDGTTNPPTVPPYEILYTTDGSIPSGTNSATITRRAPIKQLPIRSPVTLKFFARSIITPIETTAIQVEFYDIIELTARLAIPTVPENVRNYTLKISDTGDLVRDGGGQYAVVSGPDKTKQDIREIVLVEDVAQNDSIGNRTLPRFGSALNRLLGKSFPMGFVTGEIHSSLFKALSTLIELQRAERVPFNEQIRRIVSINVTPKDETSFRYHFVVGTLGGESVSDTGTIVVG